MNATVARLTSRAILGRRRALLLLLLPAALLVICVLARVLAGAGPDGADGLAAELLNGFGLAVLLPLLALIAGTGAIGPEIDDGSIVYLLAKPLRRSVIVVTKALVAIGIVTLFGALPVLIGGVIMTGGLGAVPVGYGVGSLLAGIAYSAVFLLLAVVSRNAVVLGLLYALLWESLIGQFVPGAQALSIQQWSLAVTQSVVGADAERLGIASAVGLPVAVVLLTLVTVGSVWYASRRLRTIRLTEDA
ncbi:ABC transporter permease subunit [uncultured Cellulomonas sp.]|uniref:ABC transporter permease subunit n=1 Tax=uncultured Cellulomonas sp. TaxID=189682 RepID=UPI00261E4CC9|nr:ABC transporter permease subunit [uncultured Cellulomonas sp.]